MAIPRDKSLDSTLALLREGYAFISRRCARLQTDAFETRLMLARVICAMGEDAAAMFYHPDRFTRRHALPPTALMLLQDAGSVQLLDGEAHRHRKRMFLELLAPGSIDALVADVEREWRARIAIWADTGEVVLHREVERILCAAVCRWAGVPLTESAVQQRSGEFSAMIEGAGAIGPRSWRGMLRRARTEEWTRSIIEGVRAGHMRVAEDSPAHRVAWHREPDGTLIDADAAAVELINLLRPTVAVARYVTFSALALHQHPECRERLRAGHGYDAWFVQEVRRFYPFFPAVGGRVSQAFDWRGTRFAEGDWVLLDLYGTNHDPRIWGDPQAFRPERFSDGDRGPYALIPQGGGAADTGHRCPGEELTIRIAKAAVRMLACEMEYEVPGQDLRVDLGRMPAIPASRFVISRVRRLDDFSRQAGVLRRDQNVHRAGLPGG